MSKLYFKAKFNDLIVFLTRTKMTTTHDFISPFLTNKRPQNDSIVKHTYTSITSFHIGLIEVHFLLCIEADSVMRPEDIPVDLDGAALARLLGF